MQSTTIYSFKGLLEICRYSNQPKANEVMDFLWEVADEIRRTGYYMTQQKAAELLTNPAGIFELVERLNAQDAEIMALRGQIARDRSKVLYADVLEESNESKTVGEFAKIIRSRGCKIGQNTFYKWAREENYLLTERRNWNIPSQRSMELGLFEFREHVTIRPNGRISLSNPLLVTVKGQRYFIEKFLGARLKAIAAKAATDQLTLPGFESPKLPAMG
jgi:anti-repressor protein